MGLERRSGNDWQYVLPCAFFDGPNLFLSEIQGWLPFMANDIIARDDNYWTRKAVGSAPLAEKWATERIFLHEGYNMLAMTFDIFDEGIRYMIWWIRGDSKNQVGVAVKIGGKWRVLQKNESLTKDFEIAKAGGTKKMLKVRFCFLRTDDSLVLAQSIFSRPI